MSIYNNIKFKMMIAFHLIWQMLTNVNSEIDKIQCGVCCMRLK